MLLAKEVQLQQYRNLLYLQVLHVRYDGRSTACMPLSTALRWHPREAQSLQAHGKRAGRRRETGC